MEYVSGLSRGTASPVGNDVLVHCNAAESKLFVSFEILKINYNKILMCCHMEKGKQFLESN